MMTPSEPPTRADDSLDRPVPDLAGATIQPAERGTSAALDRPAPPPPHWPGAQIAARLRSGADHAIELELSPRELGHLRLALISGQDGITVSISAERGDTLDLLRRNIDQLARDFRDQGLGDMNFYFAQHRSSGSPGRPGPDADPAEEEVRAPSASPPSLSPPMPRSRGAGATTLDLRL